MSEAESDGATGREIWIEKYRPETLDDVHGQDDTVDRLGSYIDQDDLPHLLFSGPAGVGKCVTGETPVLTNRGIERIDDVVGAVDGFEDPDAGVEVLTLRDDGSFGFTTPSHVFGKTTDDLVRVTTRDGNHLTVTPEHRLPTVTHDGLEWVRAGDLTGGTRVVRPRRTPLPEGDGRLDWVEAMDGDRTLVHLTTSFAADHDVPAEEGYVGRKKRVIAGLRRGESVAAIADAAGTTTETVRSYRRNLDVALDEPSTVCSLSYLRSLDVSRDELRSHVTAVRCVTRNGRRSEPITPPWELTPSLASFVGLAVSVGRIDGGRVRFHTTDDGLLGRVETAAESVFGLEPRRGTQDGVPYRELHTRTLTRFLDACFDVFGGTTGIGSTLVRADEASRAAFLRAVFDAGAHVTEHGRIELTQRDGHLVTLLSYLLSGVGIPSRRERGRTTPTDGSGTAHEYHTLYVSGARHLERFAERVGFTRDEKAERLATDAARDPNPDDDTVPTQAAVDTLCERLYLRKDDYVPDGLRSDSPGRERYLDRVDSLVDAATARLDDAQRTLERIDELAADLDAVAATPATRVGVRSDRLLECVDGRHTPGGDRTVDHLDRRPEDSVGVGHVRATLRNAVETLDVPYAHVADGTEMDGTDVRRLLDGGNDLGSLTRLRTIADRVRSIVSGLPSAAVLDALTTLHTLTSGDLYFDEIESVESVDEPRRVYDLTVPGTRNYVAGGVPSVMHNTTCATAIAREVYGDDWRSNFLELNASDQRGIDVVRDRIKNFARSSFGGFDHRIIFLDEADSLTSDAQSALRRTMEQFADNTRFILSCNYSSRIIDPIQSRCAVFRFSPLSDDAIAAQIEEIAEAEEIETTADGLDALVYAAGGDMRRAINTLQAASTTGDVVDDEAVYAVTSTARPEEIESMVEAAIAGDFPRARSTLETLLVDAGMAGGDVIDQLHRSAWEFDLDERRTVELMERLGEADYRITEGANERVQLEAMLAALALDD
jgi:DNA polymerase III delta prime subunit